MTTELRFDGQSAVITGAGGGLGREYALLLARRGAGIVVNDVDAKRAQAVVEEIADAGGDAVVSTATVTSPEGAEQVVQRALSRFGTLEILINNAGNLRDKSFVNMELEDFKATEVVHLEGTFNVTRAAWPHLRMRNYGRVLNTSSNSGILGNFGQSNYGAAKMGIVGLTRVLAIEGRKYGIGVNAIAPYARTPMTESLLAPEVSAALDPARVAAAVAWLVHRGCDASGELFSVGGGRVARYFLGLTPGYVDARLTPERIRDNWEAVMDPSGYSIPTHSNEVIAQLMARLGAQAANL